MALIPRTVFLSSILVLLLDGTAPAQENAAASRTPKYLRAEHDHLHATLDRLAGGPGKTGKAAQELAEVLRGHMLDEEKYVLPELGLLRSLAFEGSSEEMLWAVSLSEELAAEYPRMVAAHKAIAGLLDKLAEAGELESDPDAVFFARHLKAHLQYEDEVVYPAAVLAGKYIKMKQGQKAG